MLKLRIMSKKLRGWVLLLTFFLVLAVPIGAEKENNVKKLYGTKSHDYRIIARPEECDSIFVWQYLDDQLYIIPTREDEDLYYFNYRGSEWVVSKYDVTEIDERPSYRKYNLEITGKIADKYTKWLTEGDDIPINPKEIFKDPWYLFRDMLRYMAYNNLPQQGKDEYDKLIINKEDTYEEQLYKVFSIISKYPYTRKENDWTKYYHDDAIKQVMDINRGYTKCLGISVLGGALLSKTDIEFRIVNLVNHVYLEVKTPEDKWTDIDLTVIQGISDDSIRRYTSRVAMGIDKAITSRNIDLIESDYIQISPTFKKGTVQDRKWTEYVRLKEGRSKKVEISAYKR